MGHLRGQYRCQITHWPKMHERLTKRAVKILTTMCRKALCSLFPLGLPPDLLLSTVAQLPNITQAVLYCCVTVSMSGNRIDEQLFDSREESAMTPTVQGETLVYRQDGQEQVLPVDTAAWFAWLETASTFSFLSEEGRFTARREQAGRKPRHLGCGAMHSPCCWQPSSINPGRARNSCAAPS